jgi:hypothetical protein
MLARGKWLGASVVVVTYNRSTRKEQLANCHMLVCPSYPGKPRRPCSQFRSFYSWTAAVIVAPDGLLTGTYDRQLSEHQ